jgi:ribose transport system substrate-binding protein
MDKSGIMRRLAALATVVLVVGACSPGATTTPTTAATSGTQPTEAATAAPKMYSIGYSNAGGVGNGFREEQVCTAKAEARDSGRVSELTVIHQNHTAAEQLADLRDLISKSPDAIVFNPNDTNALNPALAEAKAAGIRTVSVDAYVSDPDTYNLYNNQVEYAKLGAKWLFDKLGGTGTVYYMRGYAGHPADNDRHKGFLEVLKDYPNIKVVPSVDGVATQWDPTTTTQLIDNFIASGQYDEIQGIWTSGMDHWVVDSIKAHGKKFVPIVGADLGAFVNQLLNEPGLEGAAVTNTAAVGGAGVALAIKLLDGETIQTDPSASQPNTVLLKPVIADNVSDAGKQLLESWLSIRGLNPDWPLSIQVEGFTTYSLGDAIVCKGPGE